MNAEEHKKAKRNMIFFFLLVILIGSISALFATGVLNGLIYGKPPTPDSNISKTIEEKSTPIIANNESSANVEQIILLSNVAALATVPNSADYSHEDWTILKKLFPNLNWLTIDDAKSFGKKIDYKDNIKIQVLGARSMITESSITFAGLDGYSYLTEFLRKANIIDQRCDSKESASFYERFYELLLVNKKPIILKYTFSSGSGGSFESYEFNNELKLPLINSEAMDGKWQSKCA